MASNLTPRNNRILRALACDLANGCRMHEAAIGIKQNTESALRAALAGMDAAELDVGMKRLAVSNAYAAVEEADRDAIRVLSNCKLRLAWKLGERWNAGWEPTGFPDRSTAVPRTRDPRYVLLGLLGRYFTANPADESAEMEATAALCEAAHAALGAARHAAQVADSALTAAHRTRRAAAVTLRKRVRGLKLELWGLIERDDARWQAFGLNIPARAATPEPVEKVTLSPLGNGRVAVSWSYAARAKRFRVEVRRAGTGEEFRGVVNAGDLGCVLKGRTAGETIEVRVVARNDGGEAAPSPVASVVVA